MTGTDLLRFHVLSCIARAVLRPVFRVQLRGDHNVFKRTLIAANHESFIGGAPLGSFLPVGATFVVQRR